MLVLVLKTFMKEELISLLEASRRVNLPKSTLTYYAKIGLIKPLSVVGKTQIYSWEYLQDRLTDIKKNKRKGFKIKEIVYA